MNNMMRNGVIAVVLVVGIGAFVFAQKEASLPNDAGLNATSTAAEAGEGADSGTAAEAPAPVPAVQDPAPSLAAQVAAHNTRESCWTIINGNVYDLTSWIPRHPGGEGAILGLCGTDGSARFNAKHGGSSQQETILAGFRINPGAQ